MELLIRNGLVVDPSDNIVEKMDIGVKQRKIVRLKTPHSETADAEVDAGGCIVTPGLIDCHIHAYDGSGDSGIPPDIACLPYGVTGAVDGGSAGVCNYDLFSRSVTGHSAVTVKAYLNVSPAGLAMISRYPENVNPAIIDAGRMADCAARYPGEIVGIKVRVSREIVGALGLSPLRAAVDAGKRTGLPVVAHATDPPEDVGTLLDILRPGDVFAHMYHGIGYTILDSDSHVKACVRRARERGVLFDAAHGIKNFSNRVAARAIEEGFRPDTISTDATRRSMYRQPLHSMTAMLSKYLCLGMPLEDVLRAVTVTPARLWGFAGRGTLQTGACADVAIFRLVERPLRFIDGLGDALDGGRILLPQMTVKDGGILYRQTDF